MCSKGKHDVLIRSSILQVCGLFQAHQKIQYMLKTLHVQSVLAVKNTCVLKINITDQLFTGAKHRLIALIDDYLLNIRLKEVVLPLVTVRPS